MGMQVGAGDDQFPFNEKGGGGTVKEKVVGVD